MGFVKGNWRSKALIMLFLLVFVGAGVEGVDEKVASASRVQKGQVTVPQRTSNPLHRIRRWWGVFSTNLIQDLFRNRFIW
jgi:hypothetical protein